MRFVSPDPVVGSGTPQTLNRYTYALNNPITASDPSGLVASGLTCNTFIAYHLGVDQVFRALADPGRRRLLDALYERNGQTLTELCEQLAVSRQAVSRHLGVLEAANLVATQWRGREKLHYLNPVPIHEISDRWIDKYDRPTLEALAQLKEGLERGRP